VCAAAAAHHIPAPPARGVLESLLLLLLLLVVVVVAMVLLLWFLAAWAPCSHQKHPQQLPLLAMLCWPVPTLRRLPAAAVSMAVDQSR
jgi:hypothetical protein